MFMKLFKVIFLLFFITFFKSYISQSQPDFTKGTYIDNQQEQSFGFCSPSFAPSVFEAKVTIFSYDGNGVTCNGDENGRIRVDIIDGIGPFEYQWGTDGTFSVPPLPLISTFDTSDSIVDLPAANYTLIVYDKGCPDGTGEYDAIFFSPINISSPAKMQFQIFGKHAFEPSCIAGAGIDNDGSIRARARFGSGQISYSWDSGTFNSAPIIGLSTVTGLTAAFPDGTDYTVIAEDENGCTASKTYNLPSPTQVFSNAVVTHEGCVTHNDTELTSTPSGGTGPYFYTWTVQDSASSFSELVAPAAGAFSNATPTTGSGTPNGSSNPMIYVLNVEDSKGCLTIPADTSLSVTIPNGPTVDAGPALNSTCGGQPSDPMGGSVGGSATGGKWTGGIAANWTNATDPANATYTPSFGEVSPITIRLTTTGGNCGDDFVEKVLAWNTASAPTINAGGPTTFCDGASVLLTSSEATGNVWSNGETTQAITVSTAGSYTVEYTAGNGCKATSAATTVTVNALPTVDAGAGQAVCAGDQVTLSGSGAVTYVWDNGIADGVAFTPLATTTYTVIGTDANN
jgi:hypothetical protein